VEISCGGTTCLACSVFRPELETLAARGEFTLPVRYLDSSLHIEPSLLGRELTREVRDLRARDRQVLMVFGDCHAGMDQHQEPGCVCRTAGLNCAALLLGRERYLEMAREGAFFLFPEWTARWRELLPGIVGIAGADGVSLMREMHRRFTYLDTGSRPVPRAELQACSTYFDLPVEVLPVSLDALLRYLNEALAHLDRQGSGA
jgi:hypothetical protein